MNPRVLVVEDEPPIREGVCELLSVHGCEVEAAPDGTTAAPLLVRGGFALVVMDLMIPPPTGLELLGAMRARGDGTPVLVLTAKGSEEDIVEGLEAGADDYVTKPFGVKELVARIKGLLRRGPAPISAGATTNAGATPRRLSLGETVLELESGAIEYGSGEKLLLTQREVTLLTYLHAHRDRPVNRAELLVHVWGYRDGSIETRTVDVHVQKLRTKLRVVPGGERWIQTARGTGYRLELP